MGGGTKRTLLRGPVSRATLAAAQRQRGQHHSGSPCLLGDGSHRRQLGFGGHGRPLSCGLLRLGRLGLSPSLLLVHEDAHVFLLAQRLLAAHLFDLLLGNMANGRKLWRRCAGATAGYTARVVVGEDGLREKLQVFVGNVRAGAGSVVVVGQRVSARPAGKCAAGVDLRRRVVGGSPRWNFHRRRGAVRPV